MRRSPGLGLLPGWLGATFLVAMMCTAWLQTAVSARELSVTYVEGQAGNPFFTSVTCGAQAEARRLGVRFSHQGGRQYSPIAQTPVLDAVIATHPDGILISPMVGPAMVSPLTSARQAGIKLVFVDTQAKGADLAASFVASDNEAGGRLAADRLAGLLGGKGTVMLEGATPGLSSTDARNKGFETEIKKFPAISYIGVQYSQSDPEQARADVGEMLAAQPGLSGIFAVSTQEVEGAASAIRNAGRQGRIQLVGFDTAPPILAERRNGIVQGLVVQEPQAMGATAMDQMVAALRGKPTTAAVYTPFVFMTRDNMQDPGIARFIYQTNCPISSSP